ncbi:RagB/SusD family nutrient uptake outer membrane protein [Chitinophagaceae bacterium LB-8]|uniref:RagB/SusD family nutrient uptake outer membrane protein n=1 Tax=Paraflavisolibacter caeni TaxID=2982496 RepID=A0A9X2Y2H3_9BACT|nr:RagB/SusD family nutrient uptake outer membrane protein [Paraflavisolibacter caeni]MCU7552588.1 RagB/SusD family nutrient uptake outer membrane protein [Paraflavisolibacter caeni]
MKYKLLSLILLLAFSFFSCTKLDEELRGSATYDQAQQIADVNALLITAYDGLSEAYVNADNVWGLSEHSTDEAVPPTRGTDWGDNGNWIALHSHTWNSENPRINGAFNSLLKVVFSATNTLNFQPSTQQAAEARFLRAFAMFSVADLFGQVPFREPGENLLNAPKVLNGVDAINFIISELNAILPSLPEGASVPAYQANKNAARVLLMKCYLNKGVFANREAPTFAVEDMDKVISLANEITGYTLANNFFDNFAPNNNAISKENIFTLENIEGNPRSKGDNGNRVKTAWRSTLHYNQKPDGWNGFTTLADFYDKFEASDTRRGVSYPGITDKTGLRLGFLIGQQFDASGNQIKQRGGAPLAFTRDVKLVETGPNLETTGIRVLKYAPDYDPEKGYTDKTNPDNDWVFYRYADVLLMKAEALIRKNNDVANALPLVNQIRTKRGASSLTTLNLTSIYDERGRELYWESSRRQDMIRFGTFLQPNALKPNVSPKKCLLFPIPNTALAVNPNLKQNDGYTQ